MSRYRRIAAVSEVLSDFRSLIESEVKAPVRVHGEDDDDDDVMMEFALLDFEGQTPVIR